MSEIERHHQQLQAAMRSPGLSAEEQFSLSMGAFLHAHSGVLSRGEDVSALRDWVACYVASDAPDRLEGFVLDWSRAAPKSFGEATATRRAGQAPGKEMAELVLSSRCWPTGEDDWKDAVELLLRYYDRGFVSEFMGYPVYAHEKLYADIEADAWFLPAHRVVGYDAMRATLEPG